MAEEDRWQKWRRNGRLSAIAWVTVLVIDVILKIAKVPAPEIDQLLIVLTGLLVGNLTIGKGTGDRDKDDAK